MCTYNGKRFCVSVLSATIYFFRNGFILASVTWSALTSIAFYMHRRRLWRRDRRIPVMALAWFQMLKYPKQQGAGMSGVCVDYAVAVRSGSSCGLVERYSTKTVHLFRLNMRHTISSSLEGGSFGCPMERPQLLNRFNFIGQILSSATSSIS